MMVNIQISPFEAIELLKWKTEMEKSIKAGKFWECYVPKVLHKIDHQIQVEIYKDITVGTMKQSHVEELTEIIKANTPKPIKIKKP